ncbi:MAG TPA: DNA-processing protein DprA [Bryobacteraceae bacterium]|jgi:DNA processing protein|nr:DNA-processing protein DprA [Bryobacteraceae bacterium]
MATQALNLEYRAISPWREMGAYEALWSDEKMWFKSLAERFAAHKDSLPSDFFSMDESIPAKFAERASSLFQKGGVRRYGIRLHGAGEYPDKLRDAMYPVELLYYQGYWDLVETRCVAVVGTRKPSPEGVKRAEKLAGMLCQVGFTVVSGLAAGIDTIAHKTAIACGAPTIAVIGTPLSSVYPRDNAGLQAEIARNHLLISQVPVCRYEDQDWRVNRGFFPERNITMSALTEATIIVEAGETSGTLIQARHALKQGRMLFILNSCFDKGLKWPHTYAEKGAIRVKDFDEIRAHLEASGKRTETEKPS